MNQIRKIRMPNSNPSHSYVAVRSYGGQLVKPHICLFFYTTAIWGQRILHLKMRNLVTKLFFILLLYRPGAMMKAWLTQKSHDCRERSIGTSWAHKFNDCINLLKSHVFRLHYWHSAIRLQSQQSDCNLSNQTAISAIRLQSPQSMNRFYHVVHIGVHIPECVKHPAHCLRLQSQQSDCNLSNQTAIPTIRLQYSQSDCNLNNQTAISAIRIKHLATCLTPCWGPWHV